MKQEVKIGQTDYTVLIMIRDTAGAPKTGLTNASAGIDVCYSRVETDNDVVLTAGAPVALATPALTDPHLDWGFLQVDATNAPGLYRLDLPDGVFASGAWSAVVSLIATGIDPVHIEFILVPSSPYVGVQLDPAQAATTFAALTVTGAFTVSDGIVVTCSTGGRSAIAATGNGAGHGIIATGGATSGNGMTLLGGAPNGQGLYSQGDGAGAGIRADGGETGDGFYGLGAGGGHGMLLFGQGAGEGLSATGGATGAGILATGGGNDALADGIRAVAGGALAADIDADITGNLTGTTGGDAVGVDFTAAEKTSLNAATPALSAAGVDAILDEVIDAGAPLNANTVRKALNVIISALGAKSSGGGTVTITFRDTGDTKDRIIATVDADGNRTATTLDGT